LKLGELLKNDITALRDAKTKLQLKPRDPIELFIETSKPELYKEIESLLSKQVNAEKISYSSNTEPAAFTIIGNEAKIHIATNKQVDTSSQKEQLLKDLEYHKGFLLSVDKKLSNERFVQNAKADVVEIERKKKADAEQKIKSIEETLKGMK
jgi:valyl-tRNA synthetase